MTPELKAKWVKALRSGRYKQAQEFLRTADNHYCCLGVLCRVAAPKGWEDVTHTYQHDSGEELSEHGMDVLGITDRQQAVLIGMNDTDRMSFSEIADWIEANIAPLASAIVTQGDETRSGSAERSEIERGPEGETPKTEENGT